MKTVFALLFLVLASSANAYPVQCGVATAIDPDNQLNFTHQVWLATGEFGPDRYILVKKDLMSAFEMTHEQYFSPAWLANYEGDYAIDIGRPHPKTTDLTGFRYSIWKVKAANEFGLEYIASAVGQIADAPREYGFMINTQHLGVGCRLP